MAGPGTCKQCKVTGRVGGRGLCQICYSKHRYRGTLSKFPRSTWRRTELMAEWELCKLRGLSVREAAERIGVSLSALRKAIQRSRHSDPNPVGPRPA